VIARVGGDEFCVVLVPTTDASSPIARFRERLAEEVEAASLPPLTVSVGVAAFDPTTPRLLEVLMAAADAAMYAEKRQRAN
jgi:diguanylate cyclase (GGDEF)-like protein